MGAYNFTASEVLFGMPPQGYATALKSFHENDFEVINEEPQEEGSGGNA